jgi:glycosyltransferase EpsH
MVDTIPKISIIVPVYNVEKYLKQCLDSLVHQTFKNIEIICINDGSSDSSSKILNEYEIRCDRIIVINQVNYGVSVARNTGLDIARGEYLMFVDSDDWIDLDMCSVMYNIAQKYDADIVLSTYVREYENTSLPKHLFDGELIVFGQQEIKFNLHRRLFGLIGKELSKPEDGDSIVSAPLLLYKSKNISAIRFLDIKEIGTFEDGLFEIQAFAKCNKFVYIDRPFYHYRKTNSDSITTKYKDELIEKWQNLFDIMFEYIKTNYNEPVYYEALNNRIVISMIGIGLNEKLQKINQYYRNPKD